MFAVALDNGGTLGISELAKRNPERLPSLPLLVNYSPNASPRMRRTTTRPNPPRITPAPAHIAGVHRHARTGGIAMRAPHAHIPHIHRTTGGAQQIPDGRVTTSLSTAPKT